MDDPGVSVVVPVGPGAPDPGGLLAALRAQRDVGPFEVILAHDDGRGADGSGAGADVDDGSATFAVAVAVAADGTTGVEAGAAGGAGLVVRRLAVPGAPAGPGAARDAGLVAARAPVVAFLDADCRPDPGWLAGLIAPLVAGTADVARGPVALPVGAPAPGPFDRLVLQDAPDPFWRAANLAVRRTDVLAVGGFGRGGVRPRRGKELGEDVQLGWRLLRAGARPAWTPATVRHAAEPRGWRAAAAERTRERHVCALVGAVPELRTALLHRRVFLSTDHARTHLALLGVGLLALRRVGGAGGRGRRAPTLVAVGLCVPAARGLRARSRWWGPRRAPGVALGLLAGDLVGAGALVLGSLRTQRPVL